MGTIIVMRKAASKRSQAPSAPLTSREQSTPHDRIPLDVTDKLFDPLILLLGYVIAVFAVGMLLYTV